MGMSLVMRTKSSKDTLAVASTVRFFEEAGLVTDLVILCDKEHGAHYLGHAVAAKRPVGVRTLLRNTPRRSGASL